MCLQEVPEILECTLAQAVEKINSEEREELKVSGKFNCMLDIREM